MGWMSCERMVISALEEKELPTVSSVGLLNESPRLVITVTLMRISVARACRVSLNARLILSTRTTCSPKMYISLMQRTLSQSC
jgi:hypothetical protein